MQFQNSNFSKIGMTLTDPNTGSKRYWWLINKVLNKTKVPVIPPLLENGLFISDFSSKAQIFNDYFLLQCMPLNTGSTVPLESTLNVTPLSDICITDDKILRVIRSLNANKAHGCDDISVRMVKFCDSALVLPLKLIFCNCLSRGVFPVMWKSANVVPVHKKNGKNIKENYRPISLLPIFGKILEKLIFDSMYSHLTKNNLLSANQSGFRQGDSTINQLISITHLIYSSFDCNPTLDVRSVYLDISKAFDRVWHTGLLFKLRRCGISGNLYNLLQSFLSNRQQRTVLNGKSSAWGNISAGVPQGSVLGPLMFLVYINDLTKDLKCTVKLFADDTSIFTIVRDPNVAAIDLNHDLEHIKLWANRWKMSFNPDPSKQAVEITFSTKRDKFNHPVLFFNNSQVMRVDEHKHLGLILDSKLSFSSHIHAAISKSRKAIGMLRLLSMYLPRETLNVLYKLYVRPHLDYGDVIYHIPHKESTHGNALMQKIESVQYSAALAVTGTWRGTSREKLYCELGWESLHARRWSRRLFMLYKIINNLLPEYISESIPRLNQPIYTLRNQPAIGQIRTRTDKFKASFFPNSLHEWSKLDTDTRTSPSIYVFKSKLLSLIRPISNSVFSIYDPRGLALLTQLRVGLSNLNLHMFRHNFRDVISPMCPVNDGPEDTEHYLLLCHSFDEQRRDLLASVLPVLHSFNKRDVPNQTLLQILLYGDKNLPFEVNKFILKSTISYILRTERLY